MRRLRFPLPLLAAGALLALAAILVFTVLPHRSAPREAGPDTPPGDPGAAPPPRETVVLLHGLGRTLRSMEPLVAPLEAAGYRVINLGYPSRQKPPGELAARVGERVRECCSEAPKVHFVTHSLGGILLRLMFDEERSPPIPLQRLGRAVMLSPPNQGSEVVDAVGTTAWFEALMGPTGQVLGTGEESLPNRLGPAPFPVGVITGDASIEPHLSHLIPGPDDGKVAVDRARLEGMEDFLVVPESHPFIMASDEVARQVVRFLEHGRFDHPGAGESPGPEESSTPVDTEGSIP